MTRQPNTIMVEGREVDLAEDGANVFAEMGVPHPEERLAKALLARRVGELIRARGLTQAKAAELLGLVQPDVSQVVRGRVSGWSVERLTRLLVRLGQEVEITVRPAPDPERGTLRVVA